MKKPLTLFPFALAAWLGCAAQAAFGIPEGLVLCPFRLLTGRRCPGCGMGHSVVHAMRGEWTESFRHHPLGIAFLAFWTGWLLLEAARLLREQAPRPRGNAAPVLLRQPQA